MALAGAAVVQHEVSTVWLGVVLLLIAIVCNNPKRRNKEHLRLGTQSKVEMDKKLAANATVKSIIIICYKAKRIHSASLLFKSKPDLSSPVQIFFFKSPLDLSFLQSQLWLQLWLSPLCRHSTVCSHTQWLLERSWKGFWALHKQLPLPKWAPSFASQLLPILQTGLGSSLFGSCLW